MLVFKNNYEYLYKVYRLFLKYYNDESFISELDLVYRQGINYPIEFNKRTIDIYVLAFVTIYHMIKLKTFDRTKISIYENNYQNDLYYHYATHEEVKLRNNDEKVIFVNIIKRYIEYFNLVNYKFNDDYSLFYFDPSS